MVTSGSKKAVRGSRVLIFCLLLVLLVVVSIPHLFRRMTTGTSDVNEIQKIMNVQLPAGATEIVGEVFALEDSFTRLRFVLPESEIPVLVERLEKTEIPDLEQRGPFPHVPDFPSPQQGASWEEEGKNKHWTLLISKPEEQKVTVFLELATY
jgi:hypothetical protein